MKILNENVARQIPDSLTFSRAILAFVIVALIPFGVREILVFYVLHVIAWTTDVLDGKVARKMKMNGKWARWDFRIDTLLQATSFIYVAYLGVIPWWSFLLWGGAWLILSALTRNKAIVAFFGTFAQVLFIVLMYWFNQLCFWLLVGFWVIIFILGLISNRFLGRLREFKQDAVNLRPIQETGGGLQISGNKQSYDVLVVGSGFTGSVIAERLASQLNKRVLIIDKRNHIGGNCYDYFNETGVLVHKYGPHYFRTDSERVFQYLSQFTEWREVLYRIRTYIKGELYPFPINRETINKFFHLNLTTPEEIEAFLAEKGIKIDNPRNSEEYVLSQIGRELYDQFYKKYTIKQWGLSPAELDVSVCNRIPIRKTSDDRYFNERFQCMPVGAYHLLFEKMLCHPNIEIRLNTEFDAIKAQIEYDLLIYTGPIDEFFDFKFGKLPYRSLIFKHEHYEKAYYQDWVQINYPNDFDFTRSVEIKHVTGQQINRTTIVKEYPQDTGEPFYPIPLRKNQMLYEKYHQEASKLKDVIFIGRLAQYQYLNMDQVILNALQTFDLLKERLL